MNQTIVFLAAITMLAATPTIEVLAAMQNADEEFFLKTVAQGQQGIILLGQLAIRKAMGRDVKQFAAKMMRITSSPSKRYDDWRQKKGSNYRYS